MIDLLVDMKNILEEEIIEYIKGAQIFITDVIEKNVPIKEKIIDIYNLLEETIKNIKAWLE